VGRLSQEAFEIGEQIGHKLLPARIQRCGSFGEQGEQITGFLNGLRPSDNGCGDEETLETLAPFAQGGLIRFDLGSHAAEFRSDLRRHSSMLV
jgi:hypothetical protein